MVKMARHNDRIIYCIDTSSLANIQRIYRISKLEGIWEFLDELVKDGRLVAPREVFEELKAGQGDEIFEWAKSNSSIFRQLTTEQWLVAQEIANDLKFKGFIDLEKETPVADPFVIALAVEEQKQPRLIREKWIIVADEIHSKRGKKVKIPDVCKDPRYNIKCIMTEDLFEREGLQLVRIKSLP